MRRIAGGSRGCLRLPPRSPNLNAFAERWVRSVKEECQSHLILFGEASLRKALTSSKSIITKNAAIQARTTCCSFPLLLRLCPLGDVGSAVENASAVHSGTTAAPHEYSEQATSFTAKGKVAAAGEAIPAISLHRVSR